MSLFTGLPFDSYACITAINATSLKAGRLSMRHMRATMTGERQAETPAMAWGKIVHLAVLEPDELPLQLTVYDGYKRGKDWEAFKAEHDGQHIVTPDEHAALMKMSSSVHSKPLAHRLIEASIHEVTIKWTDHMLGDCKARLDGVVVPDQRGIAAAVFDLKTTSMIEPRRFGQQFASLGYGMQFGWYDHAVQIETGQASDCYVIALESREPYDCAVYQIPMDVVRAGYEECVSIGLRYRACCAAHSWPGVDAGADSVPLQLPAWATDGETDMSEGTMEAGEL